MGGLRYTNPRSAEQYLEQVERAGVPVAEEEQLDEGTLFRERVAMGLRLTNGVDLEALCRAAGEDWAAREPKVARLCRHGLLLRDGARLRLTPAGFDVHSGVCAELI